MNGDISNENLSTRLGRLEIGVGAAGGIVVLGLLVESAPEIWYSIVNWSPLPRPIVGSLLVTVGVFLEVLLGIAIAQTAGRIQAEANLRITELNLLAAQARQKAEEARLELERYKAWRTLTSEQQERIAAKLTAFKGQLVEMKIAPVTTEGSNLGNQIQRALRIAGWETFLHPPGAPFPTGPFAVSGSFGAGVIIWPPREQKSSEAAEALTSSLLAEGIVANNLASPDRADKAFAPKCTPPTIFMIVGDKPPWSVEDAPE